MAASASSACSTTASRTSAIRRLLDTAGGSERGDAALVAHLFNGPSYHGEEGEQLVAG